MYAYEACPAQGREEGYEFKESVKQWMVDLMEGLPIYFDLFIEYMMRRVPWVSTPSDCCLSGCLRESGGRVSYMI